VFFWYPFFANGSSYFEGESEMLCITICCPIPFFVAGLGLLSSAIQGARVELETYVEFEPHVEHETDPLNNADSETSFPSVAAVKAPRPDNHSSMDVIDDPEASAPFWVHDSP
jgi:hypothetical protein